MIVTPMAAAERTKRAAYLKIGDRSSTSSTGGGVGPVETSPGATEPSDGGTIWANAAGARARERMQAGRRWRMIMGGEYLGTAGCCNGCWYVVEA